MPDLSPADRGLLVETLAAVVATQPVTSLRPGQLRPALEERLGAEPAYRLRREVHRLVVALEEGVPAGLVRRLPLTGTSLGRVARDLAEARGWTWEAASTACELWAAALGSPLTAVLPQGPGDSSSSPRPAAVAAALPLDVTMAPPGAERVPSQSPSRSPSAPGSVPAWPTPRRDVKQAVDKLGPDRPVLGATHAAGGLPLLLVAGLLTTLVVVLCLPIFLWDARGFLLPVLGAALAAPLARRARFGLLTAYDGSVAFTPYAPRSRDPRVEETVTAPWTALTVQEGLVSRIEWDGHRVQVGPRGRALVRTLHAAVGAAR